MNLRGILQETAIRGAIAVLALASGFVAAHSGVLSWLV